MKILHSKNSILVRFVLCIFVLLFIPCIVLLTVNRRHVEDIEQNSARQYLSANLTTVSGSIDGILTNVEKFYMPLLTDQTFSKTIESLSPYDARDDYKDFQDTNLIRDALLKTAVTNNYIYSIYTYSFSADRFFSSKVNWDPGFNHYEASDPGWLALYGQKDPASNWILTASVEDGRPILTSYRTIGRKQDLYGLISINIDASDISGQLKNVIPDSDSYCFMTDSEFNIISSAGNDAGEVPLYQTVLNTLPNQKDPDFFSLSLDSRKMFVSSFISEETGFRYFIISPSGSINTVSVMLSNLLKWYFVWIFLLILCVIALAIFIFFRPIRQLFEGMQAVQNGEFDTRLPKGHTYEINYINEHFNDMTENIQKLILENYEQELSRKDAEIHNILNQLNEHFLYNTLDSIRWTARMENAPGTSNMVYSLARFYRINLSSGKSFLRMEQIIDMLHSYLTLQEIRMKDRFTYLLDCDPSLCHYKVLKHLFLPVIENSLVHGLDGLDHPLNIGIVFEILPDDIFRFCVSDNGRGITPEKHQEIYTSLTDGSEDGAEHFCTKDDPQTITVGIPP